jgi:hypothetical protein
VLAVLPLLCLLCRACRKSSNRQLAFWLQEKLISINLCSPLPVDVPAGHNVRLLAIHLQQQAAAAAATTETHAAVDHMLDQVLTNMHMLCH